jgi:hypothetical protein
MNWVNVDMKEDNLNGVFQNFSVRCEFDRLPQPADLTPVVIITFITQTILRTFSWIRSRYEQIVDLSILFQTLAFDLENIFIRKFIIGLTQNSSENCIIITINGMPPRLLTIFERTGLIYSPGWHEYRNYCHKMAIGLVTTECLYKM